MTIRRRMFRRREATAHLSRLSLLALAAACLAGCQAYNAALGSGTAVTATDATRMTRSGFLSDYAKLKPVPGLNGIECWRDPAFDPKRFDKAMVSRIVVSLAPAKNGAPATVDPSDLKTLTDYFYRSMQTALKANMQVVEQAGPGVVVINIALTDVVPTTIVDSRMDPCFNARPLRAADHAPNARHRVGRHLAQRQEISNLRSAMRWASLT